MKEIELVYKTKWIIERIYYESDRLLNKITDTTIFEDRVIKDVGQYLLRNIDNKNNRRHIEYLIKRKVWEAENSYKKEGYINFSNLNYDDSEDDDEVEFEPTDVLADVESEVIKKETIELLAENDRRRKEILESWSLGNTNDSQVSRSLARSLGGNEKVHRIFIQRFRKACREQLLAAI